MRAKKQQPEKGALQAPEDGEGRSIATLQQIQSGAIDPRCLSTSDRRQLVALLMADGLSTAEIAQLLKVSDRSIERDKKAIRQEQALEPDPKLVSLAVGSLTAEAELAIQRIRKATREKGTTALVKIEGEYKCYQIKSDYVQSMQRLGYLPTVAQKMQAELVHHVGEVPDIDQLLSETLRLKQISAQALPAPGEAQPEGATVAANLAKIEEELERARTAAQLAKLSVALESETAGAVAPPASEVSDHADA